MFQGKYNPSVLRSVHCSPCSTVIDSWREFSICDYPPVSIQCLHPCWQWQSNNEANQRWNGKRRNQGERKKKTGEIDDIEAETESDTSFLPDLGSKDVWEKWKSQSFIYSCNIWSWIGLKVLRFFFPPLLPLLSCVVGINCFLFWVNWKCKSTSPKSPL